MSAFAAYHYGMFSRRKFLQIAAASSGIAITGTDLLNQAVANASSTVRADGSRGIRHIVILMMENRSFDHFLGWLPGADGRHDLTFVSSVDGNTYPNYPLAPDFQGCGYSDPDHSWEGWLVEHNYGKMNGFLQRPASQRPTRASSSAKANTFPVGYYTNFHHNGTRKALPDLPVIGALAEHYTTLDRYFCAIAAETYPNRFYQHAAQTDRDHNSFVASTAADDLGSAVPDPELQRHPDRRLLLPGRAVPRPVGRPGDRDRRDLQVPGVHAPLLRRQCRQRPRCPPARRSSRPARTARCRTCATSTLPFTTTATGTSGDDHPLGDIRLGERFIADAYHALADNGYLDDTVFIVTFDEWGGFYDHVPPPQVIDDTNPAERHARRRQHHPDRRPAVSQLPAARLPGPRHRGDQPGAAAPGRARGPVRALLQPRA